MGCLTSGNALTASQLNVRHETKNRKIKKRTKTRMWVNAKHDGRPAEYRWRPLLNAANFG